MEYKVEHKIAQYLSKIIDAKKHRDMSCEYHYSPKTPTQLLSNNFIQCFIGSRF